MPSSHTTAARGSQAKPRRPVAKKTAKPAASHSSAKSSAGKESWEQVEKFFDDTEAKLESFEKRIDQVSGKLQEKSAEKLEEFEGHWLKALDWMQEKTASLRPLAAEAEQLVDKARVKTHLAKMDARDFVSELKPYIDRLKGRIDAVVAKSTMQSGETLKKLSDACLKLKDVLDH